MEKVLEDVFCFLVLSFIVGFLFFSVCYTQEIKHTIMLCENKKIVTETYQLAALNIETAEISKAQANGSFFLVVGTYSQKSTTELYYILRYAYIDSFGTKLQIDKIKNMSNVWIKETETQKAVLKITSRYTYNKDACSKKTIKKVFEVPYGTVSQVYSIDINGNINTRF